MATNAVGNVMDAIAASEENAAMQQAFNTEMQQQGRYGQQAYGTLLSSLPSQGADAANTAINEGAENRTSQYSTLLNTPLFANQGAGNSSPYAATDRAALDLQGAARAKVGGMSDWQLNNAINNIKTNEALRVNFRASGNAQVFPYQMYQAQHSQDELAFWGEVLKSIGGSGSATPGSGGAQPYPNSSNPNSFNAPNQSPLAGPDVGEGMDTSAIA